MPPPPPAGPRLLARPVLLGALCVVGMAMTTAAAMAAERPTGSPIGVSGAWDTVLLVGVAATFLGYAVAVLAWRSDASRRFVLAVTVLVQGLPLLAPLLLSADVWVYWAYGRIGAVHDGNPYVDVMESHPGDPAYERMDASFRDLPQRYGPVFALVAEAGAKLAGTSPDVASLYYKALAAVAVIGMAAAVGALSPRPAFAIAFVGWNPLLALHAGGGGHNDFLMVALAVAGLLVAVRGHALAAGVLWTLAIAVKWTVVVLLPVLLLRRRELIGPRFAAGLAAGALAVVVVASLRYGGAWLNTEGLSDQARQTSGSLGLTPVLRDLGLQHRAILVVLGLLFLVGYSRCLLDAWRGEDRLARAGEVFVVTTAWTNPWYSALFAPFAAVEQDRLAQLAAVGLTAYFLADVVGL